MEGVDYSLDINILEAFWAFDYVPLEVSFLDGVSQWYQNLTVGRGGVWLFCG